MDLTIAPGPGVSAGLTIPSSDLVERFSRSSGPGGQGVNTADSRVELELDVAGSPWLSDGQRRRALEALASRLVDGRLVVAASEHRQHPLAGRLPPSGPRVEVGCQRTHFGLHHRGKQKFLGREVAVQRA